ncbi:MAG: M12 family metallo-peptidase [Planctomycetota bacterium]
MSPTPTPRFVRVAAAFLLLVLVPVAAHAQEIDVLRHFNISAYDLQPLALPEDGTPELEVEVFLDGVLRTVVLEHHSLRAPDFRLLAQAADGRLAEIDPPEPRTYRGMVRGLPGSRAAATLHRGSLTALIETEPGVLWNVEPLAAALPSAPRYLHVVVHPSAVLPPRGRCGLFTLPPSPGGPPGGPGYGPAGTGLKICDIALDADFEFFEKKGSSVEEAMIDIETIMNGVELIYERDTQITYEVTTIIVRTSEPDPYSSTDPDTLLYQFRSHWRNSLGSVRRDTAHLMTGKNLDGSVIGIAFLGVVCDSSWGYGLSSLATGSYTSRVGLTAHEVGHNWNAVHCDGDSDCYIMCSGLGGCGGDVTRFGSRSINRITGFRDSRGCLGDLDDPATLPFVETFPSTSLNSQRWSYNNGGSINGDALNEPSSPYALNLDAAGSGTYQDDDVRTNYIPLGAVPLATLSFATEHRGVETGEALAVEVWTEEFAWQLLARIVSDGVDQSSFVHHEHFLPGTAYHDRFRIRFRAEVNATNDDWYIDDIRLEVSSCPGPELYGSATPGTAGITPQISWEGGYPFLGNANYKLLGTQLYGGKTGFLFTGFSRQTVDLGGGCYLNVLPPWILFTFTVPGLPYPGYGSIEIPAPIPSDPLLGGFHFMNFFMCFDEGGPKGLTGTQGLDSTICGY